MKRRIMFLIVCIFVLPLMFLLGGCNAEKNIEIRVNGEYVQWSYEGKDIWHDIIDIQSIKSALGETYQGIQGPQGVAGKQVEFRKQDGYIQWHYVGENTWLNLISVEELQPETTQDTNPQQLAFYPLDNETYGVGAGNATQLSSIVIPETYLGKRVTQIIDSGFDSCKLKSIQIPASITSIGESAFSNCSSLTSITIPNGVTSIGEKLFYKCSSLISIEIPNSVLSIGAGAFDGCSSLTTNITIPAGMTSIGERTFRGCSSLTSITIPASITSIGESAFSNCSSLTSITIPSSVTNIGLRAFESCSSLTNVVFENTVGWAVYSNFDHHSSYISSSDLSDTETAAIYLTDTYCINNYIWMILD